MVRWRLQDYTRNMEDEIPGQVNNLLHMRLLIYLQNAIIYNASQLKYSFLK